MTPAEFYRARAAELDAQAKLDPNIGVELAALAQSYRLLAEQADKNAQTSVVYEPPPLKLRDYPPDAEPS